MADLCANLSILLLLYHKILKEILEKKVSDCLKITFKKKIMTITKFLLFFRV